MRKVMVVHASCVQKPAWSMLSWRYQKWNDDMNDMKKQLAKEVGRSTPELRNPCHQLPWRKRQATRKGSLRALMIKLVALGSTSTFAWRFLSFKELHSCRGSNAHQTQTPWACGILNWFCLNCIPFSVCTKSRSVPIAVEHICKPFCIKTGQDWPRDSRKTKSCC